MASEADAAYMSSPQVARLLGITGVGVAQLIRQGKIPAVKIANRWLIPRAFVEEFARTYVGKRGRPRKQGRSAGCPGAAVPGGEVGAGAEAAAGLQVALWPEAGAEAVPVDKMVEERVEETAGVAPTPPETLPETAAVVMAGAEPGLPVAAAGSVEAGLAIESQPPVAEPAAGVVPSAAPTEAPPSETAPAWAAPAPETILAAEPEEEEREGGATFKVSAEVYHLDRNYTFEVYDRGRITQKARIIVARLKPKIPSLPQFSFRWDYRYEHLNVDIHGVEPAVLEWWTMGQNGYTGHLPRRLAGPGHVFEAIIWLPVTFVFRGRLTLSGGSAGVDDPSSVASTTGGLRKLWSKWQGKPRP